MKKLLQLVFRLGCLVSLITPIIAIVIYPRANWLFAFLVLGIAQVVFAIVTKKQLTPTEVAERAERLLNGDYGGWDVDTYEHINPRNEKLKDLWGRTMGVGGLPEEWTRLDDDTKNKLREVIAEIRRMEPTVVNPRT